MSKIQSIVIVKNPHGWTATLRFDNRFDDAIISCNMRYDRLGNPVLATKESLYYQIAQYLKRKRAYYG